MKPQDQSGDTVPSAATQTKAIEKTPMFTASSAARYQRQALIQDIEKENPTLLCYVAGNKAPVEKWDTLCFVDMLHNVKAGEPIDLMLHTPGGDVDAAEKLISLVRSKIGEQGQLRIIVPDFAKSAGTLMALGANSILMSDSSELGPIDPQVWLKDGNGNEIAHSVLFYLDAYEQAKVALRVKSDPSSNEAKPNPDEFANRITFEKFDPVVVRKFFAVRDRAKQIAENLLKRRGLNYTKITNELMDISKYPSHGQMIGWEAAGSMGLDIAYKSPSDPTWRKYWALYCHLRLALEDNDRRIYESNFVSMIQ
jgi:ATP-dependent protease ClpP protease subunit